MNRKITLTSVLLMIGFIPLLLSSVIICAITAKTVTGHLEDATYQKLKVAADGVKKHYQNDIRNGEDPEYDHAYVDSLKDDDIEMTLFLGDTRYVTSALNDKGERNEGTKMDSAIWSKIQAGQDVHADGVNIGGKKYYVYYTPVYGADNNVAGSAWAGSPETDVKASIRGVILLLIGVVIASLILFAVIIFIVAKKVIASIQQVIGKVDLLSKGDLTDEDRADSTIREIDDLGSNVALLNSELRKIVGTAVNASKETEKQASELNSTSQQISDATDNVSNAVQDMAKGATEQADSIQKASENIGMLSDAIQTVSDNAEQLAANAVEMDNASTQSAQALKDLENNMAAMGGSVDKITESMKATNRAVQKVNEKVDGITAIASQTNLLALNASIEAARAGEAGRGFAVVAEEIGKLATESAITAQEIRDEMAVLLSSSEDALKKTDEISEIKVGVDKVLSSTAETIENLIANVGATVEAVNTISGLTEECNASKEEIVDAMSSLSAISEENAASTEETGASMQEINATVNGMAESTDSLSKVAKKLDEELSFFTIEEKHFGDMSRVD